MHELILVSGALKHQHSPLVRAKAYGSQVHVMVRSVDLGNHFVIIFLVLKCMIKTDVLGFWKHPEFDYPSCKVRVAMVG